MGATFRAGRLGAAVVAVICLAAAPAAGEDDREIDGGERSDLAKPVRPGTYHDEVGPEGSDTAERWYRYEREFEGSTVHVAAVSFLDEGSLEVEVTTEEGSACASDSDSAGSEPGDPVGVGVAVPAGSTESGTEGPDPCLSPDLLVRVGSSLENEQPAEFRLTLWEEPRPTDLDSLPTPVADDDVTFEPPAMSGAPNDLEVGSSFADAPLVDPGAYRTTVRAGSTALVRVSVDWGQRLSASAVVPSLSEEMEAAGLAFTGVRLRVFNPLGEHVDDTPDGASASAGLTSSSTAIDTGTVPVRWSNRLEPTSAACVAGDYYVAFTVAPVESGAPEVPVTLEVAAQGEPEGAPAYGSGEELLGPDTSAGPAEDGGALRWVIAGALAVAGAGCLGLGVRRLRR